VELLETDGRKNRKEGERLMGRIIKGGLNPLPFDVHGHHPLSPLSTKGKGE
jgi:hypothetical protein